ncbi:ras-related protein Rab-35-like [Corticium candelabrum]|uniref:ras-related protein Rab-35-like n=1 Tax=Corticium candelabrum TaxID=121492 RepID=UPI002E256D83|nr:ras-related protein Rab-35-like [Corticium candelabrum]
MAVIRDRFDLFKLLIVGDTNVGKSSIFGRFAGSDPCQPPSTITCDIRSRCIEVDGKSVQLEIWDTAGQERFGALTTSVYHKTSGFIVVYDISNDNSFNNVRRWLHEIDQHCDTPNPTRILVGNKCDLPEVMRVVAREDAVMFATKIGIQLFETSATENINIEDVFVEITRLMLQRHKNGVRTERESATINVQNRSSRRKCSC